MAVRKRLTAEKLIELHTQDNMSLARIGELYRVSRQRVHQLKKEYEKKYGIINRRLMIDAITLKHYLEQGWNAKQIAERFEVKPSKISRLIRKYRKEFEEGMIGVELKKKTVEEMISKNKLLELYHRELLTDKEIANRYQVSASSVGMLRRKYRIQTNNTKALRKLPKILTKTMFERHYQMEGMRLQDIADKYKCNIVAVLRLKEKYGIHK